MRRTVWIAGLLAVLLVVTLGLAACGATKIDGMTATAIVVKSNAAMQDVKSAAIDGSLEITVTGDKSKVSDPTSAFLLGAPLGLTMDGVVSEDPIALDMTIKMPFLSMVSPGIDSVEERVIGDHVYMRLGDQWYGVKQPRTEAATPSPSPSVSTEQVLGALKGLGVDIDAWVKDQQDLTADQLDGRAVYHVSEEVDVDALAVGVARLLANADSLQKLFPSEQNDMTQQQIDMLKAQSGRFAESLRQYLKGATLDLWIEKESFYLDRMAFSADIDLPAEGVEQGITEVKLALSVGLSRFNEPVQVGRPTDVKSLADALPGMWQSDGGAGGALLPGASPTF